MPPTPLEGTAQPQMAFQKYEYPPPQFIPGYATGAGRLLVYTFSILWIYFNHIYYVTCMLCYVYKMLYTQKLNKDKRSVG